MIQVCFEVSRELNLLFEALLELASSLQDLVDSGEIGEVFNITNQTDIEKYKEQIDLFDEYLKVAISKKLCI